MNESTPDGSWAQSIDLAREADFDLGSLSVRPARCEIEQGGATQTLQRRVMQVLVALAQARGSVVSQHDLVIRCWRGLSVSDDAIVRCISKLRKIAAGYTGPPFAIETIPGVGYRLTSPRFVEHEHEPAAGRAPPGRNRAHVWWAAAALLIVALAGAALWTLYGRSSPGARNRVVVQPFETLSNSGDVRALARRIPNEVVNALGDSQIDAVLVGQQASKDYPKPVSRKPGLIVTGILRDDGHNMVVDLRLEDGATRAALWSTEFKRNSRETSDLPLEVAARVADVVNMINFARNANPPLIDDSALSALLQTTDMIRDSRGGDWAQLIDHAQGVVTRHPDFAFGHSVLAGAYLEAALDIDVPDRAKAMADAARREADLTLKLDPQDAGAYAVLSGLEFSRRPYNYRAGEVILLRGIKFARHPKEPLGALYQYEGNLLGSVGRVREGLSFQLIAQAKDQWSPAKMTKLALVYANLGNLPAARDALQKAVQRWPNYSFVRNARRYIAGFFGQPSDALATIDFLDAEASSDQDENAIWRTFIQARSTPSRPVTAAAVRDIRAAAEHGAIARETEIMMLAGLGETRQAIEVTNLALDHQELDPKFVFAPVTRNMRQDPGFLRLVDRMGLISYWRETGKMPDFCTDPATRSECSAELRAALKT